jgi:hypothetical protein
MYMIVHGIKKLKVDEDKGKMSFVRMVGKHDAIFLYLMFSIFTFIFNVIDFSTVTYSFASLIWFSVFTLYMFDRLMEDKDITMYHTFLSWFAMAAYCVHYVYLVNQMNNPWPKRSFPLFSEPDATPQWYYDMISKHKFSSVCMSADNVCYVGERYPWIY